MDNESKSSTLPWYIKPIGCSVNDDKTKLIANDGATLKYYKFIKQSDGNYYIQNKENGNYIFAYYDGSHYSIGLGTTPTNSGSLSWTITTSNNGFVMKNATNSTITTSNNGFVMKNATNSTNVYLEYYNGSFCGYKSAPSVPIYLYH